MRSNISICFIDKYLMKVLLFFSLFSVSDTLNSQSITDFRAVREADKINFSYILNSENTVILQLFYSTDKGVNWIGPVKSVEGNIGAEIQRGNLLFSWDVFKDVDELVGDSILFRISNTMESFVDIRDGKVYSEISIGHQAWMAENLNYEINKESYCSYINPANCIKYGRLYSWQSSRVACPAGWHLPSQSEWLVLIDRLGGKSEAGLKIAAENSDVNPNGFSARFGGYRKGGLSDGIDKFAYWWAVSDKDSDMTVAVSIKASESSVNFIEEDLRNYYINIRCVRDLFSGFSNPLAISMSKNGIIVNNQNAVGYIKSYVEKNISEWQRKGEFEKTVDYKIRVTEETRNIKVQELTSEAVSKLKEDLVKVVKWDEFILGQYDADNETYLITSKQFGNFAVKIPIDEAQEIKKNWDKIRFSDQDFLVNGNNISLAKFTLINPIINKLYQYDSNISTAYIMNNISYNFAPIEVEIPSDEVKVNNNRFESVSTNIGKDPVDFNIPINQSVNGSTFALVIGNENYKNEIKVPYAKNDASIFSEYCKKTLGIPAKNIRLLIDGTYGQILGEINWLRDVLNAYNGEAKAIVYYAGHGMPSEKDKSAFILPVDGNSTITQTALKLDDMYASLTASPSKSVTVFLDACFSGSAREGSLIKGRGVRMPPKENLLAGNLVVFSATSYDETALPLADNGHGLFTYYVLKKLQESKGKITLLELSSYVIENVKKTSVVINNKAQNPKVISSPIFQDKWQTISLD
jgi:uncharacterized protein (TIGR02145 family)